MPRLFVGTDVIAPNATEIHLGGDVGRHLAGSLRLQPGEHLSVVADAVECGLVVTAIRDGGLDARVNWRRPAAGEPGLRITVLQALIKDGMDEAIDSLVQAGATAIAPVLTRRCVSRPDTGRAERRLERWQAIAREAAQLSYRAAPPDVMPLHRLDEALTALEPGTRIVACALDPGAPPLADMRVAAPGPVALCIGPEGGLDHADLEQIRARGGEIRHLGVRVLRARLAGSIALAVMLAANGELAAPPPPLEPASS